MKKSLPTFANKSTLIALLLWLGAVTVFFIPSICGGKIIAPLDCLECVFHPFANKPIENVHNHFVTDGVSQYIPYKRSIQTSFEEDGYIGWNPYTFNGNPISDNTMVSPGDPLNLLYAVLPFWLAWDLGIILQFFIAGCGMILLMRYFRLPLWGALLAAVSFAFYSQFVLWMYHKWMGAMIWGPFLVWALIKYKQYIVNVPAIIFMALTWRTGHLQSCAFAFILVACTWVANIWKTENQWPTRKIFLKTTFSFLLTGILGAMLSVDVFVDTLQRMSGCKDMPFGWGVNNIPTFCTLLFPTSLGIPETLDIAKMFKLDLFDIKFGGSTVFILSLIGCFNRRAPIAAKIIFITSMVITCTPLITYLYSRSTVIMALGMSWLAAWQLCDFTCVSSSPQLWKRIYLSIAIVLGIWFIASIGITLSRNELTELLTHTIKGASTGRDIGRAAWLELRLERFLSQILIWDWRSLMLATCLVLGVFCCSKIRPNHKNAMWMAGIVVLTFSELLIFSSSWISYSNKPKGAYVYQAPTWMKEFKEHVKDGSVAVRNTSQDKDFLCTNHLSAYNVRLADGYETFRPIYLAPLWPTQYSTEDYAQAGISHIICNTRWGDVHMPDWNLAMTNRDFKLYANPAYKGRYFADDISLTPNWRTSNRIHLTVPPHARNLIVMESFHPGWKAYLGNEELSISSTERGALFITLPDNSREQDILIQYRTPYRWWCYFIMGTTLLALLAVGIYQKRKMLN